MNVLDKLRDFGFTAANWREIGSQLTPVPDLDDIQTSHSTAEECFVQVIDKWMHTSSNAGWQAIAEAVTKCRRGKPTFRMELLKEVGRGI